MHWGDCSLALNHRSDTFRLDCILTHWGRDKMAAIFQTIFSNWFSWITMHQLRSRFYWNLFPRVQWTIFQHWFKYWLGAGQATSHYLNQWWLVYRRIYASLGLNELNPLEEPVYIQERAIYIIEASEPQNRPPIFQTLCCADDRHTSNFDCIARFRISRHTY